MNPLRLVDHLQFAVTSHPTAFIKVRRFRVQPFSHHRPTVVPCFFARRRAAITSCISDKKQEEDVCPTREFSSVGHPSLDLGQLVQRPGQPDEILTFYHRTTPMTPWVCLHCCYHQVLGGRTWYTFTFDRNLFALYQTSGLLEVRCIPSVGANSTPRSARSESMVFALT